MEGKEKLRKYDFVTSIILIIVGIYELILTSKMPMRDTYSGVESTWYVSPALFPLFIGIGLILLSIMLMVNSITSGGLSCLIRDFKEKRASGEGMSAKTFSVLVFLLHLASLVYLLIPRIDFFISLTIFLFSVIAFFYLDDEVIGKRIAKVFLIGTLVLLVLAVTGLDKVLNDAFFLTLDILALLFTIYIIVMVFRATKGNDAYRRKVRIALIVALVTPTILCPVFRYGLLVPLPVEGIIFNNIFNTIYYMIR